MACKHAGEGAVAPAVLQFEVRRNCFKKVKKKTYQLNLKFRSELMGAWPAGLVWQSRYILRERYWPVSMGVPVECQGKAGSNLPPLSCMYG